MNKPSYYEQHKHDIDFIEKKRRQRRESDSRCKDRIRKYGRKYQKIRTLREYNLSSKEYEEKFKKQNGVCHLCKKPSKNNLCVDHDHKTGKIRSLLCRNCNLGLGNFKEDIKVLQEAISYLSFYKT